MPEKKVTRVEFPNVSAAEEKQIVRKRVAAYAGVSTERDKQENSLRAQKDYFRKYIKSNPEWVYAGLYVDDGISGNVNKCAAEKHTKFCLFTDSWGIWKK